MIRNSLFLISWLTILAESEQSDVFFYKPSNVTRSTLSGIEAYRSSFTLDWLPAEASRHWQMYKTSDQKTPPVRLMSSDCMMYTKPASWKVAKLMLELLKNLDGDEGTVINELIQALARSQLLVETSKFDEEPNLEALVETPDMMVGEPHATFPRVMAMVWMTASDTTVVKNQGWCPIEKVTRYLSISHPSQIAKKMRELDPILARARFIMEEFIQHVSPLKIYDKGHLQLEKKIKLLKSQPSHQMKRSTGYSSPVNRWKLELAPQESILQLETQPATDQELVLQSNFKKRTCASFEISLFSILFPFVM